VAAPARSVAAGRPLHDAASSRAWDAAAVAAGVSGVELMAAAGGAAARTVRYRFPRARRVLCVCGGGANGGDGLVVARLLRAAGRDARAVVVGSARYTGDAAWAHAGAQEADVPIEEGDADLVATRLRDADLVVDGLLGTGFSGPPRPGHAAVIDAVNAGGVPVLALDVPSGVDASTGEVPGPAIEAAVTVTFGAAKLGLVVAPGLHHAGEVVEVAIGHPAAAEVGTPAVRVGRPELRSLPARGTRRVEVRRRQRPARRRLDGHDGGDHARLAGGAAGRGRGSCRPACPPR
jgi:NAD(P)H-hydrate epimerase